MKIHTLSNGAKVLSLSLHGFHFSDGTECEGQDKELVDEFTLERKFEAMFPIKGMKVNKMAMVLSEHQLARLSELSTQVDIVILPFPMLTALREQGVRENYPNCVAFNATKDTMRSPPDEKIVDIDNWSY